MLPLTPAYTDDKYYVKFMKLVRGKGVEIHVRNRRIY